MKDQRLLSTLIGMSLATTVGLVSAQTSATKTEESRSQVKMDRDEFLKTHTYDAGRQEWMLKPGVQTPTGVTPRAEITAARDKFLSMHRWNAGSQDWVKLPGPREMSKVSRSQVKMERDAFTKTMVFNNETGLWSPR